MLSYQHIYHAGNFADVQKHAVLVKLMQALAQKPQKFCALDTHAGRGVYDLTSAEAQKIGEFHAGIEAFWQRRDAASPIADYLDIVTALNSRDELKLYPGSAKIMHGFMRAMDRLVLIEKHPGEMAELQKTFSHEPSVRLEQKDGFQALVDLVPFAERRGLILIDPSYEMKTDYAELARRLQQAYKKWPQGQYMVWYPILEAGLHRQMLTMLRQSAVKDMLVNEMMLDQTQQESFRLLGTGLVIVNPPFGFEKTLQEVTDYIAAHLPMKAQNNVFWLDNQQINPETGTV